MEDCQQIELFGGPRDGTFVNVFGQPSEYLITQHHDPGAYTQTELRAMGGMIGLYIYRPVENWTRDCCKVHGKRQVYAFAHMSEQVLTRR